jgi:heptosyltransferase III
LKPNDASSLLPGLPQGAAILIIRLRSLGDIILETPALAALHAWRPDLRTSVLIEPRFAAALQGNPDIAELIFSSGFAATAAELRRRKFAAVFNQHGGPRSAFLTAASGSPRRVCWKGFQYAFLYNVLVPDAAEFFGNPAVHMVEHRISQFYSTGLPRGPVPQTRVFPQPQAAAAVAKRLAVGGIAPGAPYCVIQPGARLTAMRWPATKFAAIARWLRERQRIASVVNLGTGDAAVAEETRQVFRDCAFIPEPLDLRELIALVAGAELFIGNDSGPAHLAAATGRPSVVIYGATNPAQWHPWQTPYRAIHTNAVFRPQRGDKSLAESMPREIQSIAIEEVRAACEDLLASGAASGSILKSTVVEARRQND